MVCRIQLCKEWWQGKKQRKDKPNKGEEHHIIYYGFGTTTTARRIAGDSHRVRTYIWVATSWRGHAFHQWKCLHMYILPFGYPVYCGDNTYMFPSDPHTSPSSSSTQKSFRSNWHSVTSSIHCLAGHPTKGLCKGKQIPKIQKKTWIDLWGSPHPPTPYPNFFLETHHWHGQNTDIIITNNF